MLGFELLDAHLGVIGGGLIRSRLTAVHPFGARRFAPVQNAYKPSAFFKLLVAEELFDEADVGPALQHVGRAGGSNQMS